MIPFHIASFLGGQSNFENKGIPGSFKYGKSLNIRKVRDSLSCQQDLVDDLAPGTMTALSIKQVVSSDGNVYHFTEDGKIFSRHSDGTYHLVYTDTSESGLISGADEWYDVSGATYLFWTTPTRVNIKQILGPSYVPAEPWTDVNKVRSLGQLISDQTNVSASDVVVVGSKTYTFKTTLTEVKATGTLTSDNTNVTDGDTVTINSRVYRFKNTMAAIDDVKIGADADTTMQNLIYAINGTGTPGTNYYTGTTVNADVTAGTLASHAFTVTAISPGTAANSYATTETSSHLSFGAATLAGGVDSIANEVFIGADANTSLENLVAAINASSGSGLKYSSATTSNAQGIASGPSQYTITIASIATDGTGDTVATTTTSAHLAWKTATLTGGSDTWPKTNLTSADFHTMKPSNGALLICNSGNLAFVGYDRSYTSNALTLGLGNEARTLVERGVYSIIGVNSTNNNKEESSLYAWDGLAQNYNNKQLYKVKPINAMIDTEYALMQVGSEGLVYISDMNNPMPIMQFKGGGQCNPDGVDSDRGLALFGVFGNSLGNNGVWSFGRLQKNAPPVLNFEYPLDCDEIGSVKKVGSDIFITYRKGTDFGVKKVDQSNKAPAIYQSLDLVAPMKAGKNPLPLGRNIQNEVINLQMQPLPEGCAVEVWYRIDKIETQYTTESGTDTDSEGWIQAEQPDNQGVQLTKEGTQRADFKVGDLSRVIEVMIKLFPYQNTTPDISEINPYFQV